MDERITRVYMNVCWHGNRKARQRKIIPSLNQNKKYTEQLYRKKQGGTVRKEKGRSETKRESKKKTIPSLNQNKRNDEQLYMKKDEKTKTGRRKAPYIYTLNGVKKGPGIEIQRREA